MVCRHVGIVVGVIGVGVVVCRLAQHGHIVVPLLIQHRRVMMYWLFQHRCVVMQQLVLR
jgi:hypothetical protein